MSENSKQDGRLYFLDWLRILAFAGLVIYHVGMYYVSWNFHVKSPFAGPGLEPWMKLTEPWRMSLLFMVSGAAAAYMLKSGPNLGLVGRRSAYLLLPLLVGMVLIVPPQSYFQVVQQFNYSGSYTEFLGLYFSSYRGFCNGTGCLIMPTWNHLWFLPYLWVYTMLVCALLVIWPSALRNAAWLLERILRGVWLLLIPAALILVARLALFEKYPSTHALFGDWFNHAIYFGMFATGAALAAGKNMWERMASVRWLALGLAFAFWAYLVFVRPPKPLEHAVVAVYQWSALVACFGFAVRCLNKDWPIRKQLAEAVFPLYILHQTVIIVASQVLLPHHIRPSLEAPLIIAITFVLSYSGYLLVRQFGPLRPLFGLRTAQAKPQVAARSGA